MQLLEANRANTGRRDACLVRRWHALEERIAAREHVVRQRDLVETRTEKEHRSAAGLREEVRNVLSTQYCTRVVEQTLAESSAKGRDELTHVETTSGGAKINAQCRGDA